MAKPTGGYDTSLLRDAPNLTSADRQAGYDDALLQPNRPSPGASREHLAETPPLASHHGHAGDAERGAGPGAYGATKESYSPSPAAAAGKRSFWRTGKGKATLALLALLIIGAAVGGGVGGTVGKNKSSGGLASSSATSPTDGSSTLTSSSWGPSESQSQGVGGGGGGSQSSGAGSTAQTAPISSIGTTSSPTLAAASSPTLAASTTGDSLSLGLASSTPTPDPSTDKGGVLVHVGSPAVTGQNGVGN